MRRTREKGGKPGEICVERFNFGIGVGEWDDGIPKNASQEYFLRPRGEPRVWPSVPHRRKVGTPPRSSVERAAYSPPWRADGLGQIIARKRSTLRKRGVKLQPKNFHCSRR